MKRIILITLIFTLAGGLFAGAKSEEAVEIKGLSFEEIERIAKDSEVSFFMWGGSPTINDWVTMYVGSHVKESHNITLNMVPINDAAEFVNKLATEKLAGLDEGTADLIWINGENFKNAREADLLFGPYTNLLPNMKDYADTGASQSDFGYPTQGYEAPYGRAQFVFEYDSANIMSPPGSFSELKKWLENNPGRFTYPQPPDFTGSAFIRQAFYELTGGYEQYMTDYDGSTVNTELFNRKAPLLWNYLNEIKPYLWQEGKSYPKTITVLETLFSRGEVDFAMYYSPSHGTSKIMEGLYNDRVRTFVMDNNSIANTHFTAIPFNAPNKSGALVVTNFLLSPEAQLNKAAPLNWGDLPIVDYNKLDSEQKGLFDKLDLGIATLPISTLSPNSVPEIPSGYVELLEAGWEKYVLNQ